MALYELHSEPADVIAPALVVAFEDWVDAAGAASGAARHIAVDGDVIATFDPDALFDYRSHRPVLDIVDGIPQELMWPRLTLTRCRLPERDLFVLVGPEPDFAWKVFAKDVLELGLRIGIVEHVSIGAIPTAVPHTAPTPVMMTAASKEQLKTSPPTDGLLRVPAAAVSLIERTFAENGIPAVGFWAQVPHYATPFAAGSIALIRKLESHLAVTIGAGDLEDEDKAQRVALQNLFAQNPEASDYLERLESMVDEEQVPPAENIGEEVERFLRNQRGRGDRENPFGP